MTNRVMIVELNPLDENKKRNRLLRKEERNVEESKNQSVRVMVGESQDNREWLDQARRQLSSRNST